MRETALRFEEKTIANLESQMVNGELTSVEITKLYLERIAGLDKKGPAINAVLEINPDALFIARAMDMERAAGKVRGPLHGMPVLLKDNLDTADKMHTSAGSLALANHYAKEDSFVVTRLRAAGAVILGKVNMTEWANFITENMKNGYSSRGGQVLNPYGPGKFDVGGSSAGSGASVAANLTAVAIGTETSGSILHPSSRNSVVGIKPTVGLVSRTGIIPIAHSQDTAGPMTRTVADAATLLSVISGMDERDPATLAIPYDKPVDYTEYLDASGLHGARIGIPRRVYYEELTESQLKIMDRAFEVMRNLGATIVDSADIPTATNDFDYTVLLYEFKPNLNAYLSHVEDTIPVHSLADAIQFNNEHPDAALKYGQTIFLASEETSGTLTEAQYLETRLRELKSSRTNGIDAVLREHELDAIVFPGAEGSAIAAQAGYPSITVPGGYDENGEALGITFCGMAFSEPTLIKLAYAFEQATRYRIPPRFEV